VSQAGGDTFAFLEAYATNQLESLRGSQRSGIGEILHTIILRGIPYLTPRA